MSILNPTSLHPDVFLFIRYIRNYSTNLFFLILHLSENLVHAYHNTQCHISENTDFVGRCIRASLRIL
jgi:hypothetical protein